MKINNFRGDLTDNSAKKEALDTIIQLFLQDTKTVHTITNYKSSFLEKNITILTSKVNYFRGYRTDVLDQTKSLLAYTVVVLF